MMHALFEAIAEFSPVGGEWLPLDELFKKLFMILLQRRDRAECAALQTTGTFPLQIVNSCQVSLHHYAVMFFIAPTPLCF
jgi:hypothetical protein